ncbi:MAG: lysoplasmalogenase [Anaerolineaceae bacterium]|nr:lysoplasmalogenase [Anaerolineaceae bacterium]
MSLFLFMSFMVLAFINWFAAASLRMKLYYTTKPFVLLFLILWFVHLGGLNFPLFKFFLGLVFSLLGDIALIFQNRKSFIAGMVFFAIAHLCYALGFSQWRPAWQSIGSVLLLVAFLVLLIIVFPKASGNNQSWVESFRKAAFVYAFFLLGMAGTALACFWRKDWPFGPALMASAGALLFVTSDSMIGAEVMHLTKRKMRFWIIMTYHVAQALIVGSVLLIR